ncbi:MAG: hypothetical protein LIO77_07770 [Rikenellaceae bacterium]|nr:hypothetical protein [Rikenellaceae bacterium]
MIKFTAFRTRKPRQFNYIPRYYDPEQEARDQRRKQVLGISDVDEGGEYVPGKYIRSTMRGSMERARSKKRGTGYIRLLLVFALVGVLLWIWFDNIIILLGSIIIGFIAAGILSRK